MWNLSDLGLSLWLPAGNDQRRERGLKTRFRHTHPMRQPRGSPASAATECMGQVVGPDTCSETQRRYAGQERTEAGASNLAKGPGRGETGHTMQAEGRQPGKPGVYPPCTGLTRRDSQAGPRTATEARRGHRAGQWTWEEAAPPTPRRQRSDMCETARRAPRDAARCWTHA